MSDEIQIGILIDMIKQGYRPRRMFIAYRPGGRSYTTSALERYIAPPKSPSPSNREPTATGSGSVNAPQEVPDRLPPKEVI